MNKSDLITAIAQRSAMSRAAAQANLDATLEVITEALEAGDSVVLSGFGIFEVTDRPERTGRNPRTGEPVSIRAARVPKFRPGKALKASVQ